VTHGHAQYVFVDTPGFHKPRTKLGDYMVNVTKNSIADVDLTILVVEPIPSVGPQEEGLIEQLKAKNCPVVLAINKIDTVEKVSFWK
jgi:GTP-binding protein Era